MRIALFPPKRSIRFEPNLIICTSKVFSYNSQRLGEKKRLNKLQIADKRKDIDFEQFI